LLSFSLSLLIYFVFIYLTMFTILLSSPIFIECRARVVNTTASYSGGLGVQISTRRPAILKLFVAFLSPSKKIPGYYLV
jgi:hypothetical protein